MLLHKNSTIPYIGKTNNLERRLRQHNGEISGGARRTHRALDLESKTNWERVLYVKGFIDERAALHFENRFQRERRKASSVTKDFLLKKDPLHKGLLALKTVMNCDRPTRAALPLTEYGVEVVFENDEASSRYEGRRYVDKIKK
jgi:predicted GIY-YIG superfamily endonuclease